MRIQKGTVVELAIDEINSNGGVGEYRLELEIADTKDQQPDAVVSAYDAYETEMLPVVEALENSGAINLPNRKLAIISSDNAYSKAIYEGLRRSFTAGGWKVVFNEVVPFGEINDWRSVLVRMREQEPALIVNTDYIVSNAATFLQQFLESPTDSIVFIMYAPSLPEFIDLTGEQSNGVIYNLLGGPIRSTKNELATVMPDKYQARFGVGARVSAVFL